jgi:hypothetical protein
MSVDLFSKALPLLGRIHGMKTASIKGKAKRRSVCMTFEDIQHGECTRGIRFGRFISGLLNCDL